MASSSPSKKTPTEQPWPPPWARTIGFAVGMAMMIFEAVVERSAHLFVYGIGFILTGLPLARGLEKVVDLLNGFKK